MIIGVAIILCSLSQPAFAQPDQPSTVAKAKNDGSVNRYVAMALENSPQVQAAFHDWQSSVHRIARARTLPEPTLTFAAFVQSVETRVGPQQARISVKQAFPWPTKLTAGGKAATAEARAAETRLEAISLRVAEQVAIAYWSLWEVRATRRLHREHLDVLDGLSESVRARVAVGGATLADLQQVDLTRARLDDGIRSMDEREHRAIASLRAVLGVRETEQLPTTSQPSLALPDDPELRQRALNHPAVLSFKHGAEAAEARARAEGASRLPSFTVGADWILTGPAAMPDTLESGKDAVLVGVGLKMPLWQGTYRHNVAAERESAQARRAEQQSRGDNALGALEATLATLRDGERRARVLSNTLLPQADAAYASVLGNYTVGLSTVAQTLLGQRDLLDLAVDHTAALADHNRAWAQLDQLVGTAVPRTPVINLEDQP